MKSIEIWKPVRGYEGKYEVSSFGRVRSLRFVRTDGRTFPAKVLSLNRMNTGYESITLYGGGVQWKIAIHRLVAMHFIPNKNSFPEVNHKDGIRHNNYMENLEWCTRSYNIKDMYARTGRVPWNKGLHVKSNNGLEEWFKKHGPWNRGKKMTKEQRAKFREKYRATRMKNRSAT